MPSAHAGVGDLDGSGGHLAVARHPDRSQDRDRDRDDPISFIPISVAALEGVGEHPPGLASGLLKTSTQFGAAIGTAIASSVAGSRTDALLRTGRALPAALPGGFHQTFWVLAAIALTAPPATIALAYRSRTRAAAIKSDPPKVPSTWAQPN